MSIIRVLEPADEAAYKRLWGEGLRTLAAFFRTAPEDDPDGRIPTRYTEDSFTLGAFAGTALIGIVSLERDRGRKLSHKALLFRMLVAPAWGRAGVGRALLEAAIGKATAVGDLRQIHLTVLATNERARRLYQAMGFQEFACEPEAIKIGAAYVAEIRMVRFLTPRS